MTATTTTEAPQKQAKLAAGITKVYKGYNADPARITRRAGWNKRFDFGDIEELANSIAEELKRDPSQGGLLNPIRVRRTAIDGFDFELVDGDRRLTAVELLLSKGVVFPEGVAVKIVDKSVSDVELRVQMITANTGKPFLALEEAQALKELVDAGMSVAAICKAVGRTDVHVRETLALLDADDAVKMALTTQTVAPSMAKTIVAVSKGDKDVQKSLMEDAKMAKGKGDTAKAARARLAQRIQSQREANAKKDGRDVKLRMITQDKLDELGRACAKHFGAVLKEARLTEYEGDLEGLRALISKDEQQCAAYMLGVVQALATVGGIKNNLEI